MNEVAVTVPLYKKEPERNELLSLMQCRKVLGRYPVIFFAPESLELSVYQKIIPQAQIIRFADAYFTGIPGYNRLMLSPFFYQHVEEYRYILIFQPDAWVFRDELDEWCRSGFDYIGGPYRSPYRTGDRILPGNGGFSLRKVQSCIELLTPRKGRMFRPERLHFFEENHSSVLRRIYARMRSLIPAFNDYSAMLKHFSSGKYNEDCVFYEFSALHSFTGFQMAPVELSFAFSWDLLPEDRSRIPFGCHGWIKNNELKEYIQQRENDR